VKSFGWLAAAIAVGVGSAHAEPAPAPHLDPGDLHSLTNDPITAKADRIDGDETKGVVAFTFDDGPNPETTPHVIDALEKYDIPATFFIVTQRLASEKGKELLHRELDAGFMVGSHSVTHPNLRKVSADKLAREINHSVETLAIEADRPIGLFRAPYGALNAAGRGRLKRLGLTEVFWSIDTLDWRAHNEEKLRHKVVSMIKKDGGGVVLMHDVKPITAKVVSEIFDDLEAENCARIADHHDPIVPVSLHYFLKDGKTPREIPEGVKQRTAAYKAALPERCARRATTNPEPGTKHASK
jgi:peptidoglycan/xylan/chitin deacetylase (PgdA/CDA1 family)